MDHNESQPQYTTISVCDWKGSSSNKFNGNRSHKNHLTDQLDNLLVGSLSKELTQGRKHFAERITIGTDKPPKSHLKIHPQKFSKQRIFQVTNLQKLINLHQNEQEDEGKIRAKIAGISVKGKGSIGMSKIKGLQIGLKQTGIYRNFYKSQARSLNYISKCD